MARIESFHGGQGRGRTVVRYQPFCDVEGVSHTIDLASAYSISQNVLLAYIFRHVAPWTTLVIGL